MSLGLVAAMYDAIANGPEGGSPAAMSIAGLDPKDPSKIYEGENFSFAERCFQYWPETISDSIEVGWEFKNVGGASHALAQWSSNGGRTISFDVQLSRFTMPLETRSIKEKILSAYQDPGSSSPVDNRPFNVNIRQQIRYLRGFCYPSYLEIEGVVSSLPPPIMALYCPNVGLSETGGDLIYCVMTGCDVTYTLLFRDGTPRRATVSLTLRQVVQTAKGVLFRGFGKGAPEKYSMQEKEFLSPSAGRLNNDIEGVISGKKDSGSLI